MQFQILTVDETERNNLCYVVVRDLDNNTYYCAMHVWIPMVRKAQHLLSWGGHGDCPYVANHSS